MCKHKHQPKIAVPVQVVCESGTQMVSRTHLISLADPVLPALG